MNKKAFDSVGFMLILILLIIVPVTIYLANNNLSSEEHMGNMFCNEKFAEYKNFVEFDSFNEGRNIIGCKLERVSGTKIHYFKVKKVGNAFYEMPK